MAMTIKQWWNGLSKSHQTIVVRNVMGLAGVILAIVYVAYNHHELAFLVRYWLTHD